MNELVFKGENGQAVTNSLLVAEKFGKEHKHVLDAIRELIKGCAENSADPLFAETIYENQQNGQTYPLFIMNRDGFSLLVMGFTGKKALKFKLDFISAFNRMEEELRNVPRPDLTKITRRDLVQMLLDSEMELEKLRKDSEEKNRIIISLQNEKMSRQANSNERIDRLEHLILLALEPLYQAKNNPPVQESRRARQERIEPIGKRMEKTCPGCMLVRGMSLRLRKEHNIYINSTDLYQWLRDRGYLLSDPKKCNLPSDESQKNGWMVYAPCGTTIKGQKYYTPYITPKGYIYFAQVLKEEGGIR